MIETKFNTGKIITFEGTDGCFKETNAGRLYKYLKEELNLPVNIVSFPRYKDESSVFIRKYLSGDYGKVNPEIVSHFYALDRFNYIIQNNVKERLFNGEWFIFDRYVESNMIYSSARLNQETNDLLTLDNFTNSIVTNEYGLFDLPHPNLIIALYSDFNLTQEILKNRETTDINESDLEFQKILFDRYDYLINKYGWNRINVFKYLDDKDKYIFKSEDEIFDEIIDLLKRKELI